MGNLAESRIEVRLSSRHRQMLDRILARRSTNASAFFRGIIEEEDRRLTDGEFLALLDRLQASPIDLPSPEVLKHELEEAHCPRVDCDEY